MSVEIINPFSIEDMNKIKQYDEQNNTSLRTSIEGQYSSMNEKNYRSYISDSYITELYFYKGNNRCIDEICYANCEKDMKKATILPIPNTKGVSSIISEATDFIFSMFDITDISIIVPQENLRTISELEKAGFISLGDESGNIIYFKEKEEFEEYRVTKVA